MNKSLRISIFLSRLALGWLIFYAGITKVLDSGWSAAGYLNSAKTFPGLFQWFARPENIGWVNFLNEWGLTIIGVAIIVGLFVRWASIGGMILMILYYLPALDFPRPDAHSYIVDQHIIFILAFAIFFASRAGKIWGLDSAIRRK